MQPVSGLFFDFRLLLFQLLDDAALLYGAPDGQRVVYGGFLTAVDTETGKGTCRDVLCGIGYDLPVECRGGGFPFPDDGQAERRDKVLVIGIVQAQAKSSYRSWISRSRSPNFSMRSSCPVAMILVMSLISLIGASMPPMSPQRSLHAARGCRASHSPSEGMPSCVSNCRISCSPK